MWGVDVILAVGLFLSESILRHIRNNSRWNR